MRTVGVAVCSLVVLALGARGDANLPDLGPQVISVFPLGARQGETLEVQILGRNLDGTRDITFARPDIQGQVLSADFFSVKARISVGGKVPVGLHDYRLRTARGTHVGVFHVGSLPRLNEVEPNNDLAHAQKITLPVMIDGVVESDDYDVFRFHAEAGQTLIFDVMATRAGSRLDSTITILDERGAELDFIDDYYIHKDPYLSFAVLKTGDYFVRVAAATEPIATLFDGGRYSSYRLVAGAVPHMSHVLPAGARRGATSELRIAGLNLEKVDRVVLGESLAEGKVVAAGGDLVTVRMAVPASVAPGLYPLRAFAGSFEAPLQIQIVVSDLEEKLATPARSREHPQQISFPVAISGVFDTKKARDFFAFDVQSGERLVFDVDSMKLGFLDDPLVAVYTPEGKLLASHDDRLQQNGDEPPNLDSYLVYTFEKAGRYVAMIRDCAERGNANYVYRLAIYPGQPDFDLKSLTPELTLYRGRMVPLPVRVRRFGGWSTPVEVWADNLPPGVTSEKMTAEPKDTIVKDNCALDRQLDGTNVRLPMHIAADAPGGDYAIRLHARGVMDGRVVEHTAEILYWWEHVGKVTGAVEEQKLVATVTDLPAVVFEAPESVSIAPGKVSRLQFLVRRYDDGKSTLRIEPETPIVGVKFENNEVPPGKPNAELKLTATSAFKPGWIKLRAGTSVSPPIELKAKTQEDEQ
ncbi:MAG TPA: pre-peptidase C-terminal domain-containing protein [Bryobacteraceae bacterium]|nr:pre-peptidase C-terminal domain-containing protein [Bryobacteraceae bacterium]